MSTAKVTVRRSHAVRSPQSGAAEFIDGSGELLKRVGRYVDANVGTLCLTGPPGSGKTTLLQKLAAQRGRKLHTVIASELVPSDLLGSYKLRGGATVFVPGLLVRALMRGDFFYIDEVLHADKNLLHVLHSLIDHRREIYLPVCNRTVQARETFRLFLSYNGVNGHDLPRAFRDRLIMVPIERLDQKTERAILIKRYGISVAQASYLTLYAELTRSVSPHSGASLRQLLQAAAVVKEGVSMRDAAEECILNGVAGSDERLRQDILNRVMASELSNFEPPYADAYSDPYADNDNRELVKNGVDSDHA